MPSSPQSALLCYIEYAHTRIPADYLTLQYFFCGHGKCSESKQINWWMMKQGGRKEGASPQGISHICREILDIKVSPKLQKSQCNMIEPLSFFFLIVKNLELGDFWFCFVFLISALILESTNYWKQSSREKILISPRSSFCLNSTTSLIPPGNNSLPYRATFSFKIDLKTRKQKSAFLFPVF